MIHHTELFQGVVPSTVTSNDKLDAIDSTGYKFTYLYEGDKTTVTFTTDKTDQKNIPPFAQLTYTIPNWSTAFGLGPSALTGGLNVAQLSSLLTVIDNQLLTLIVIHQSFQL